MRRFILSTVVLTALAGGRCRPLAGKSITVLLPSPQGPNIAADFEKETGIHVDLQTLSWDDIRPKLVTALLAGTAPADVTEFDWSWTGQFNAAGWYLPLNNVIDADTVADIAVAKIFTVDGKLLGIPYTNDFRVMLVNKKHFADAGITKMPTTLDELFEDAKQIKAKGIVQYPVGLPLSPDRRRLDQLVSADQGRSAATCSTRTSSRCSPPPIPPAQGHGLRAQAAEGRIGGSRLHGPQG